jgi:hypothetical protein
MAETTLDPAALETIAATPATLRNLVGALPAAALSTPSDGDWSPKDVVAHLLDVQDIDFNQRIRRTLTEDRPLIEPVDPDTRREQRDLATWDIDRLLDAFETGRKEQIGLLRDLTPAQMARLADHAEAGEISVSDLAHHCAVHDLMHIGQITRMVIAQLAPKVGNMGRYLNDG